MEAVPIEGQIVHKRSVSRNILFLDIVSSDDSKRSCAVLKREIVGDDVMDKFRTGPEKLHVGDEIKISGLIDDKNVQKIESISITERWSISNPGKEFVPIPPTDFKKDSESDAENKVCKFFVNTGLCSNGGSCRFRHDLENPISAKQSYVQERRDHRLHLQRELDVDAHDPEDYKSHCQRAKIFAEWIASSFDLEHLKDGVVLDVAGGRGDLSFQLILNYQLSCIVIDPREVANKTRPKKQRKMIKQFGQDPSSFELKSLADNFDTDFFERHPNIRSSVRLVVGLHPDQATEPLVDVCLQNAIPFAVIPCCVFASTNQGRRLKASNKEPTTYQDFCQYLMEKSLEINAQNLNFRGRNKVLFKS